LKALLGNGPSKRVKWQGKIGIDDWVTGTFDVNRLDLELGEAMEKYNFKDNLDDIIVSIKSNHSKGTWKLISLIELSLDSWDMQIEPILKQEHVRFLGYKLEVIVECIG
jgi:hypothetical protein